MPTTFIDLHCHLFNFVDIPVYETLSGKVGMKTAIKLIAAMTVSAPVVGGILLHKIRDYKDLIQFFERPVEENMRFLAQELKSASLQERVIMTPLVMDFDCVRHPDCSEKGKPCTGRKCPLQTETPTTESSDPTTEGQYRRLVQAIDLITKQDASWSETNKVFPFLGFDLRKLTPKNSDALKNLKNFWKKHGVTKEGRLAGFDAIENGKALGIKLYPPIGFNPYPKGRKAVKPYVEFYEWCITEGIPITVHCQSGSYSATRSRTQVNKDTHANNWLRLFEDWEKIRTDSDVQIEDLRINFAHFGGDEGLDEMFDTSHRGNINKGSWTYPLLKLVQKYPNAYADLAAFEWGEKESRENIVKLLDMEIHGGFGSSEYPLREKLLWGSDVPMVVSDKSYRKKAEEHGPCSYSYLLNNFRYAISTCNSLPMPQQVKELVTAMSYTNSKAFLLG
ncbi:MAG: amidohydrolase [Pseudodesulfovibrio sp.]